MFRPTLALLTLAATSTFAGDDTPVPAAKIAAEGTVQAVKLQPTDDGFAWAQIDLKVTRCVAGPCTVHQSVKAMVPASQWRGKHGETMGLIRYEWSDKDGHKHTWTVALKLDDETEKERFERESDSAG